MLFIERAPAACTRCASQSGLGPIFTFLITRAVYLAQRAGSLISMVAKSCTFGCSLSGERVRVGYFTGSLYMAPTSRAKP